MPSARSRLLHRKGILNCAFQLDKDGCSHQRDGGLWGDLWSLTRRLLRWEETRSFSLAWAPFMIADRTRWLFLKGKEEGGKQLGSLCRVNCGGMESIWLC